MVLFNRPLSRVVPSMAPTTRSVRLSMEAEASCKRTAFSPAAMYAKNPIRTVDGFQDETNLKVYKAKSNEKPGKGLQQKFRTGTKKKTKSSQVDKEEIIATDMEDLCTSDGTLADFSFAKSEVMTIRASLLSWYDSNHRVLPWRINLYSCLENPSYSADGAGEICKEESGVGVMNDASLSGVLCRDSMHNATETEGERAYAVWVSEMMLQQTRVATVISYYQRWMRTWPTVYALAQATQEEVNSVWAGLGYYRRARFLLEGAKKIVEEFGGEFPRTAEELQKVPGIGTYTAGAIASIAFKQVVPVVDGNVIRVLCRLRAISLNPKASTTVKLFWALASQLVDEYRPGDFNQALMELGATICTPTSPSCALCSVSSQCAALKLVHRVEKNVTSVTCFPAKVPKSAPREEYVAVCIIELESQTKMSKAASSLLLVQRPPKGLLAGLWEFPSAPLDNPNSTEKSRLMEMDNYLCDTLGFKIGSGGYTVMKREEFGTYVHVFSHIRLHMFIQWMLLSTGEIEDKSTPKMQRSVVTKWVDLDSMNSLGLTSGVKKVYEMFSALRQKQLTSSKTIKRKRSNLV